MIFVLVCTWFLHSHLRASKQVLLRTDKATYLKISTFFSQITWLVGRHKENKNKGALIHFIRFGSFLDRPQKIPLSPLFFSESKLPDSLNYKTLVSWLG